jgi:hypothetical protein
MSDIRAIFANLEMIVNLHLIMFEGIERRLAKWRYIVVILVMMMMMMVWVSTTDQRDAVTIRAWVISL